MKRTTDVARLFIVTIGALCAASCGGRPGAARHAGTPTVRIDWSSPTRSIDGMQLHGFAAISFANQLPNGTVVVGDRRVDELDFFPVGAKPFAAAEKGQGPGEVHFLQAGGLVPPDSTLVIDETRVSFYTTAGVFARSISLPHLGDNYEFIGVIDDSLLMLRHEIYNTDVAGLILDSARYVALSRSTGAVRQEFTLPDRHSYVDVSSGRTFWTFPPFLGRAEAGVVGRYLAWSMGNGRSLYFLNAAGGLVDSVHLALPSSPLSDDDVAAAKAERIAQEPDNVWLRDNWERMFAQVSFPKATPVDKLIVGSDDLLWFGAEAATKTDSTRWWACDRTGTLRATLVVPPGIQLTQVTPETVVGVARDQYDVERVVTFSRQ